MNTMNAKRVKNINGMEQIGIDLKPHRSDSFLYCHRDFDVTNLAKYMEKKKKTNPDITYFHAFIAALGKTIYNREKLNRFVKNRHIYEHNDVTISFVAKVAFEDKSEEIMIMVPIKPNDTIDTVSAFIKDKVDGVRKRKDKKEGANDAIDTLGKLPNIIRVPVVGLLKWFDEKGILPKSLTEDNLYYSTTLVSNIGTLKNNGIHHHIANFGTCSSVVTMGEIKNKLVVDKEENKSIRKICDWGMAFDDRVADGFYLIKSMEMIQYLFDNPELLEEPAGTKIELAKK